MHPYLDRLLKSVNEVGNDMTTTYFNTQVILQNHHVTREQQAQAQQ
jgi:hypothetical protein